MRIIAFENGTPNEVDRLVIELGTLVQQGVAQDDPERWVLSESNTWILDEEAGPGDASRHPDQQWHASLVGAWSTGGDARQKTTSHFGDRRRKLVWSRPSHEAC